MGRSKITAEWVFLTLFLLVFPLCPAAAGSGEVKLLAVTDPRLCSLASFIGGVNLKAVPLSVWDTDGSLVRLETVSGDVPRFFLALDRADAANYGLDLNGGQVILLYSDCPVKGKTDGIFADPAKLPFVGQRILVAVSRMDPGGYEYYQRRLAEFQSRLDSTLSMGRKVLKGAKVLDINGSQKEFFQAAGCLVEVADDAVSLRISSVLSSRDHGDKKAVPELARDLGASFDAVILDRPFPDFVTETAEIVRKIPVMVMFSPLESTQDPVTVMYDRYLAVWNALRNGKS